MTKTYAYDISTAAYEAGAVEHPQVEILRLAPDAHDFEAWGAADCWVFRASEIAVLPAYVRELLLPLVRPSAPAKDGPVLNWDGARVTLGGSELAPVTSLSVNSARRPK